jgi:CheY-like chemotaxis protein
VPHILLVEDDRDLREVLSESLRFEGYDVLEAVDGLDALTRVRDGVRPALVLLDLIMPRMDGRQFLEAIRGEVGLTDVPVVLVTGTPPLDLRTAVHTILKKPVGLDDLLACIRGIVPDAAGESARSSLGLR